MLVKTSEKGVCLNSLPVLGETVVGNNVVFILVGMLVALVG